MSAQKFTVRTWTKGDSDFQEDDFPTRKAADEFADGSRLHGYEATVTEKQPDLFEVAA